MKYGKLVIVQRSLFPYSIERTVYTIWYKIYTYQNILCSKADTNQWFPYRLTVFFHPDNLSFLTIWISEITEQTNLLALPTNSSEFGLFCLFYVTLSLHMMHQDASLWFSFICLFQICFPCFPPWWFLCVVFQSIIPQLSHRAFIFCPVTLQDLFSEQFLYLR